MIAVLALIALSSAPPAIDPATICKDVWTAALPQDRKAAYDSCLRDERDARDKLKAKWGHYSAAARAACVGDSTVVAQSYVELWTCLEIRSGGLLGLRSGDRKVVPPPGSPPLSPQVQPRSTDP